MTIDSIPAESGKGSCVPLRLHWTLAIVLFALPSAWATPPAAPSGPRPVKRLQLEYHSGAFRLISEARLNKVIPASDSLPVTSRALSGFWYELQSPKGEVLYRRILENPITLYTEVPAEKSGGAPSRAEVVPQQTVFSILVPEVPGTNQSVIFSSPPGRSARSEPASARARIPVPGLEKEGAK